ncbi:MAG: NUDIX domain-containing protein [Gammaproteobacteria bacterium]|nr:NUDIX domain-containing protein [Gammaproteobacteria bacterium]
MNSESPLEQKPTENNRPFIGVGVLLWKGDCLLLGQRVDAQGAHTWQFPGGCLETGESVLECAAREVREETSLNVGIAKHAAFSNELFSAGDREYVTLYVTACYVSGEPEVMEPDKCLSWQWFHYRQLPNPLFLPITCLLKQAPDLSVFRVGSETQASEQK